MDEPCIFYTKVDEAPELASASLLPIIQSFTAAAGIRVETKDISLAGRILAGAVGPSGAGSAPADDLQELGERVKQPGANVIKLPNISASIPQLKAAIAELQSQGYDLPDYPDSAESEEEKAVKALYDKVTGSAVNPVLREGNSDRRAAKAVKAYAKRNPHSMGAWHGASRTHVASMSARDFHANEASVTVSAAQAGLRASSLSTAPERPAP